MSAVLALPAAVRLPRTVAARRALLAGLFLVGFVALGFAFGPGAHADDRTRSADLTGVATPARTASEGSTPDRAATRDGAANRLSGSKAALQRQGKASGAKLAEHTHAASDAVAQAVRPAAEQAAPVTDRITEPVNRVVREAGDSAGAALPVHLPSGEHTGGSGDGATHQHGRTPGDAQPAGPRTADQVGGPSAAPSSRPADCLPEPAAEHPSAAAHEQHAPGHNGLPGQCPQAPVAPASHTAGDGHGPRGGDHYAAAPADPLRFRLLPGGVRTADGAPTRRRAEEILEFPG
ncbi:hypothetical protein SAMN05428954_2812 [Streptomyces sp. 2112.3]|uniref:hypothetical protein n=1 Tax=Streptomyces sp. 2112.3 TaxID=1881023 RepID=UPI0008954832|nr:hypothetical protein [Streptomyces sp. 2112.3]SEE50153.1 hypothetical protein SAMN05428954_2812 [Streptomyces sp. 2112.3]